MRALFAAGATTSYHGLGNTLYAVLTHPTAAQRLRADPTLIGPAVDEMLRWEPPLALLPRVAPFDVEVAGHDIPAGTMLLFGIASANRDPAAYVEPDRFDIDRQPSRLLTFGFGSHHCPGSHLARAQIAVATERLLARLPGLTLTDTETAQPSGTVCAARPRCTRLGDRATQRGSARLPSGGAPKVGGPRVGTGLDEGLVRSGAAEQPVHERGGQRLGRAAGEAHLSGARTPPLAASPRAPRSPVRRPQGRSTPQLILDAGQWPL